MFRQLGVGGGVKLTYGGMRKLSKRVGRLMINVYAPWPSYDLCGVGNGGGELGLRFQVRLGLVGCSFEEW